LATVSVCDTLILTVQTHTLSVLTVMLQYTCVWTSIN